MSLKLDLLDAMIDGHLGRGLVITRQDVIGYFHQRPDTYTGVVLSNSETQASHSPTYDKFTMRIADGEYRVHPGILLQRMNDRGLI